MAWVMWNRVMTDANKDPIEYFHARFIRFTIFYRYFPVKNLHN